MEWWWWDDDGDRGWAHVKYKWKGLLETFNTKMLHSLKYAHRQSLQFTMVSATYTVYLSGYHVCNLSQ